MTKIRRRDLIRVVAATGVAATAATAGCTASDANSVRQEKKRRPQYQANSREVQDFYRVNRYPAK
jgi:hypothetical protein